MKRLLGLSALVISSVFFGLSSLTLAESPDATATTDRWWEQVVPLFPHTSGKRWVYVLSGKQYVNGGELHAEVKGQQPRSRTSNKRRYWLRKPTPRQPLMHRQTSCRSCTIPVRATWCGIPPISTPAPSAQLDIDR